MFMTRPRLEYGQLLHECRQSLALFVATPEKLSFIVTLFAWHPISEHF
jgi:hypothetical protein